MKSPKKAGNEETSLGPLRLIDDWEGFFQDFWSPFRRFPLATLESPGWVPAVDLEETDGAYHLKAEMPGMKKEDVRISIVDNILTVSGEKKSETRTDKKKVHRLERNYGAFQRSFSLPARIQADRVEASFKEGVLEITVPKSEEAKPKEVEIKVE
jgi:HSP20 family protein